MTARTFVTCAGLMIFAWLAATYLRVVPMDSYTPAPTAAAPSVEKTAPVMAAAAEVPEVELISARP